MKIIMLKVINGDSGDIKNITSRISEIKKEGTFKNYEFIVTNDKLDFYTPKRFIKEMMCIVNELKKIEVKK